MNAFVGTRTAAARDFDRSRIAAAILASRGVVSHAAAALHVSPNYLYKRAKMVGLNIPAVRAEAIAAATAA